MGYKFEPMIHADGKHHYQYKNLHSISFRKTSTVLKTNSDSPGFLICNCVKSTHKTYEYS